MISIRSARFRRLWGRGSRLLISVALATALSGCGGGGGGGGINFPTPAPAPTPPPPPFDAPPLPDIDAADPFNTAEFQENYGLRLLNAHTAYAEGVSGAGITVAVIDDGIDIDHPDLDDNISPLSVDIRTGNFDDIDTLETHGTQVAGIIAAERNDIGVHGVAPGAEILMIQALGNEGFTLGDVADGIDYARVNGARIINLSITADTLPAELRQAMDRAVAADMLIIVSAGNNLPGDSAINSLDAISNYATLDSANGQALAVGAIDEDNNMAFFSNRPGSNGQNFYLLAPGVDIVTTDVGGGIWELTPDPDPQFFGVDLDASGTSFAAPHVAGAAAVLWEMFPNLSAAEVAEILLTSSVDVGVEGVDSISGHGILDLGAAVQPMGAMTVALGATSFEDTSPVTGSFVVAGGVFGDAFSQTSAFSGAFVQDRFRRAYSFDFRDFTSDPSSNLNLAERLELWGRSRSVQLSSGAFSSLSVSASTSSWWEQNVRSGNHLQGTGSVATTFDDVSFFAQSALPGGGTLQFSNGFGAASFSRQELGLSGPTDLTAASTRTGFGDFAQGGMSVSTRQPVYRGIDFWATYARGAQKGDLYDPRGSAFSDTTESTLAQIGLTANLSKKIRLAGQIGRLQEQGQVLDLVAGGAFAGIEGGSTQFLSLGALGSFGKFTLFGSFTAGSTTVSSNTSGLFDGFSRLRTSAFQAGMKYARLFGENDQFSFSVSQPLRIEQGSANLSLATGINADDVLTREFRTLSLSPSTREINYRLSHSVDFGAAILSAQFLYRENPGHSRVLRNDASMVIRLFSDF